MKVYAKFDKEGRCVGWVCSSDPSFTHDPSYEEITDGKEKQMIGTNPQQCKRVIDFYNRRKIVLLPTVE